MSRDKNSKSIPPRLPAARPATSSISETLTLSEIESLRQAASEGIASAQKVFAKDRKPA